MFLPLNRSPRPFLNLIVLCLISHLSFAQAGLKGRVIDPSGHALDAVTITLSQQQRRVSTNLADSGHFELKAVPPGTYTLTGTLVGYQSLVRTLLLPRDTVLLLMQPDTRLLNAVTVSAGRPIIERRADRVTFNIEGSIMASGTTA